MLHPVVHDDDTNQYGNLCLPHAEAFDAGVELGAADGGVVRPEHLARSVVTLRDIQFVQEGADLKIIIHLKCDSWREQGILSMDARVKMSCAAKA